jgi:hypothetical protein
VATTVAGDYCNEYRLPVFRTNTNWPFAYYTRFAPSNPHSNYQQTSGISEQSSTCQAQSDGTTNGWGQWIQPADGGACGGPFAGAPQSSCGMHHYLSYAGTSNYPWSTVFGASPELTFLNKMQVGMYRDRWTPRSPYFFAWHHLCLVLEYTPPPRAGVPTAPSVLELCAVEWRSPSAARWDSQHSGSAPAGNTVGCAAIDPVNGSRAQAIGFLNPANPAGQFFTTIMGNGQSGTIKSGATGEWVFEGTVTKQNLQNVINAMAAPENANCYVEAGYWSSDPSQWRFLGIEDGIEAGGDANLLDYFGSSESLLMSWTNF